MSDFKIDNILELPTEDLLKQGVYLFIIHATTVPPHLLLCIEGKVFSLSTRGPAMDISVQQYLRYIKAKRVPSVFVQLKLPLLVTNEDLLDRIRKITSSYPRVDVGIATCLTPIKDFCSEVYFTNTQDVNLIFDLLPKLNDQELVESYFHLNLESDLLNGQLSMKRYGVFEVNECIYDAKSSKVSV